MKEKKPRKNRIKIVCTTPDNKDINIGFKQFKSSPIGGQPYQIGITNQDLLDSKHSKPWLTRIEAA